MEEKYKKAIKDEFINCAKNTLTRVKSSLEKNHDGGNYKPFHESILIPEAILWSKFERSFSTSFGQRLIEEVSSLLAKANGAEVSRQKATDIDIDARQADAVENHLKDIKEGKCKGCWKDDLEKICKQSSTDSARHQARIISDLWYKKDGKEYYFSIKTVKPNIDQTAEAKRDLLKLKLNDPTCSVFYGLYYNPWGEKRENYKHNPPMKVFDFHQDEVVLIGKEYWDQIGGVGAYEKVLEIAKEAGQETKKIVESFAKEIKV